MTIHEITLIKGYTVSDENFYKANKLTPKHLTNDPAFIEFKNENINEIDEEDMYNSYIYEIKHDLLNNEDECSVGTFAHDQEDNDGNDCVYDYVVGIAIDTLHVRYNESLPLKLTIPTNEEVNTCLQNSKYAPYLEGEISIYVVADGCKCCS